MIHFQIHEAIATLVDGGKVGIVGEQQMNIYENQGVPANVYYKGDQLPESGRVKKDAVDISVLLTAGVKDWVNSFKVAATAGKIILVVGPKVGHYPKYDGQKFTKEGLQALGDLAGLNTLRTFERAAYHNHETGVEVYAVYTKKDDTKLPSKKAVNELFAE